MRKKSKDSDRNKEGRGRAAERQAGGDRDQKIDRKYIYTNINTHKNTCTHTSNETDFTVTNSEEVKGHRSDMLK